MRQNDSTTRSGHDGPRLSQAPLITGLTILAHPDVTRVGERAPLADLDSGRPESLSRSAPQFCLPSGARLRPLEDAHISRRPILFERGAAPGSIVVDGGASSTALEVDGSALAGTCAFSSEEIDHGVVLLLSGRVALLLHRIDPLAGTGLPDFGLIGDSAALSTLRREIRQIAPLDVPILLTGESGSGKELVAHAIHCASPRRERPYVTVNLGAIPPTLAAAELFGATRGAFTGADRPRQGYFGRAQGGTLFLDEIGEAPGEVQVLLLRAFETGEIQTVGSEEPRRVDVRLIAASDADLHAAVERERFRAPLLHRLGSYSIEVPPLRARRDDVGRLLAHFLREELRALGALRRLDPPLGGQPSWLPAAFVARLAGCSWPGNVRQLRNVARRVAIVGRDEEIVPLAQVERLLEDARAPQQTRAQPVALEAHGRAAGYAPPATPPAPRRYRAPGSVSDEQVLAALRSNRFKVLPTAAQLGLSRTALYERLEQIPGVRKATDLGRDELHACYERCAGDVERMVDDVQVSPDALKRRLKDFGLA